MPPDGRQAVFGGTRGSLRRAREMLRGVIQRSGTCAACESVFTHEGTDEIHRLILGTPTGLPAFD